MMIKIDISIKSNKINIIDKKNNMSQYISQITNDNNIIGNYVNFEIIDNVLILYFTTFRIIFTAYNSHYEICVYENDIIVYKSICQYKGKKTIVLVSVTGPHYLDNLFRDLSVNRHFNIQKIFNNFISQHELNIAFNNMSNNFSNMYIDPIKSLEYNIGKISLI